jgi:uncharacterized protein (DUF362 family)
MVSVIVKSLEGISSLEGVEELLDKAQKNSWLERLKSVKKVVIKPNLCYIAPWESGITTNVDLVGSIIKYIKDIEPDIQIYIVESDNNDRKAEEAFEQLGYSELEKRHDLKLLNLTKEPYYEVEVPDMHYSINIPDIFIDDIFLISVANLKVHLYQKMTCICKNQFGCVPDEIKERYHQYMEETLYFLNKMLHPNLSIIDGKIGLEGIGPVTGTPKQADVMLIGNDPIATDTAAASIMGLIPCEVPHLRYAYKKERIKIDEYEIEGMNAVPACEFTTDSSFNLIRSKINITRFTDTLNGSLKRVAEKIYGIPFFIKRVHGFGMRKLRGLVGR